MGVPLTYNLRNLVERKATTIMTALGIGLTVAVLVTSVALMQGLRSVFQASGDPRQFLVLRKGTDAELSSQISVETYHIVRALPGVALGADGMPLVSPEGLAIVNLPSVDLPEGMNVSVRGLLPVGLSLRQVEVVQGRMFSPGLHQVVVGADVARRYPAARIGGELVFGKSRWEVVGIFRSGESAANSEIWVDLNQLRTDFEVASGSSSLLVRADSPDAIDTLKKLIDNDQRLQASVMKEKDYYAAMSASGLPLEILGFFVAVIMAIGSGFAATNTMYAAVVRRTREIGTLRALGFTRMAILVSFVAESVCLSLLGGIAGVLMAYPLNGVTTGIGNFATFSDVAFKFRIGPGAVIAGLVFSAGIGALGGLLPAWSASKKDIIVAMRDA